MKAPPDKTWSKPSTREPEAELSYTHTMTRTEEREKSLFSLALFDFTRYFLSAFSEKSNERETTFLQGKS